MMTYALGAPLKVHLLILWLKSTVNLEIKGNGYTFKEGNSVRIVFASLLKRGLFWKEKIWEAKTLP